MLYRHNNVQVFRIYYNKIPKNIYYLQYDFNEH